ncbi:MAG: Asp-tRNA(Asn)/Glu-tRNA(Gln) amidotransferase subunit GatC [Thermodesulfovibrionales bacterium]|nr:Asp-tRNA(Asn)/Glu-tRNA(Gln) amidotransferase subunit GatC [Thermodesulfovibrionales bacterium]
MLELHEVKHIARLARIDFTDEEIDKIRVQLNSVVDYIGKLNEVGTEGIEPTSHVIPLKNIFREDLLDNKVLTTNEILQNAPQTDGKFFIVPKIIE